MARGHVFQQNFPSTGKKLLARIDKRARIHQTVLLSSLVGNHA